MKTVYLAAVSGGKDSTAMCLYLREQGIEYRAVHFDTGWEHPDTVRYVRDVLPYHIGPIEVHRRLPELDEEEESIARRFEQEIGFECSPMIRWIVKRGTFPARLRRWCTQDLKVLTVRDLVRSVHDGGELPVNVVGIRADESKARAKLPEREISTSLDCMVWRPLLNWKQRDVIDIHKRHGVAPNPLYLRGSTRVGCWPCVMAGKPEIRQLGQDRIALIERLERYLTDRKDARRAFFQSRSAVPKGDGSTHWPPVPIREIVAWSKTSRGGKTEDMQTAFPGMNDGCLRWGLCDLGDRT